MIFEWFNAVFSGPTEQARLFTVAISTILAVTLLLMNQWFIGNRARKERLIEKLEDLTSAMHEFYSLGLEVNRCLHLSKKGSLGHPSTGREFGTPIYFELI